MSFQDNRINQLTNTTYVGFNLVIEVLVVSSAKVSQKIHGHYCFNLVIEVLVVSSGEYEDGSGGAHQVSIS